MPKTPSNKLFQLIKSLTGSEKRYFKLFINQGEGRTNKYMVLFDAIDAQDAFDDEALKQLVYADEPIQSRKYSELKSYLYDSILKSLQFYDEKTSVDFKLKGMLQSVRVLFKRSLYEDCMDVLNKIKKLAYKYEKYNVILEVLTWEKDIAYAKSDIDYLNKQLKKINSEEQMCTSEMRRIQQYRNLFLEMLVDLRKRTTRNKQWGEKWENEVENILEKDLNKVTSYRAKVLYFRILALRHFFKADKLNFYKTNMSLIAQMESNRVILNEDISEYISALSNLSVSCGTLRKYDEVTECLVKLKKLKPNTLDDELKIHRQYYASQFNLCIIKGNFEEGLEELNTHLKGVKKFDDLLFERHSFYFQYFYIYYGAEKYTEALEYLNRWLNLPKTVERQDLQSIARILNLIIHYEMGNTLLLDSLLRSTYRFLNKRNSLYQFERKMVNFIREANKIQDKKTLHKAFLELKQDFDELKNVSTEKAMLQVFNIEAWLTSKIEKKSFAQVIKENFEKQLAAIN